MSPGTYCEHHAVPTEVYTSGYWEEMTLDLSLHVGYRQGWNTGGNWLRQRGGW